MGRLAVILGSNALGPGGEEITAAAAAQGAAITQRHIADGAFALPHMIDHEANLKPLVEQGCDRVLAIGSVGSLKPGELDVGALVCPDDFIALNLGDSIFGDQRAHSAPGFSPGWREEVIAAWSEGGQAPRDGGVYWQARGPRFETPAEIRLMAAHADVVGMTIATECVVARELGLDYAALCVVDNLANGLSTEEVSTAGMEADRLINAESLREGLEAVLPRLGAVGR